MRGVHLGLRLQRVEEGVGIQGASLWGRPGKVGALTGSIGRNRQFRGSH